MKAVIEPSRFRDFLNKILIYHRDTILDSVNARFTPKGLLVNDVTAKSVAVIGVFSKKYFIDYEVEDTEVVNFTDVHREKAGYITGKEMTLRTTDMSLVMDGDKERYTVDKFETKEMEYGKNKLEGEWKEVGYMPTDFNPIISVAVNQSYFDNMPSVEKYRFNFTNDEEIKIIFEDIGELVKDIPIATKDMWQAKRVDFVSDFFDAILANMDNLITLTLNDKGLMLLFQEENDYKLTYMQARRRS